MSARRIDLYRGGFFILEAKEDANAARQATLSGQLETEADRRKSMRDSSGCAWQTLRAEGRAEAHARDLPAREAGPDAVARTEGLASRFRRARADTVREMPKTLVALGQARPVGDGRHRLQVRTAFRAYRVDLQRGRPVAGWGVIGF